MSYNQYGNRFQKSTPAVTNLIIANVVVFLAQIMFGGLNNESTFNNLFALHHYKSDDFRLYQVITHMFMHGSFMHILFNMFGLYMFGANIERVFGPKRFLVFYMACGIGAAVVQLASYAYTFRHIDAMPLSYDELIQYQTLLHNSVTVGASGAIMGVLAAFGYLFANTEMMIIPFPFPIKAKWAILGIIAIDVFSGIAPKVGDNVAHFAHVGGALTGFLIVYIQNKTNRRTFY
ncbi:rhomboid family intramembrane serine protease [Ferruginibacter yonginensis]|uniref:Rhomboid family intramembrane serine protease n=1 Tax=Ferruginibacter yonginensis TaxID=1310416 RepID=A0ABV8QTM8_9BACT